MLGAELHHPLPRRRVVVARHPREQVVLDLDFKVVVVGLKSCVV